MNYWIFQGNPDRFDVSKYVAIETDINWETKQYAKEIMPNDLVFIWRAAGKKHPEIPGVIAIAKVRSYPKYRPDDQAAYKYYRTGDPTKPAPRVDLRIVMTFGANEIVRKDKIKETGTNLQELTILKKHPRQTNYRLTQSQAERLLMLCGTGSGRRFRQDFVEAPDDDPQQKQITSRKVRRGQGQFRANLLNLYDGKCAISGWTPAAVLHAAHIVEHSSKGNNKVDNGLLLRADLHELFDEGLLRINPKTYVVVISDDLKSSEYWEWNGKSIRRRTDNGYPGLEYLMERWQKPALDSDQRGLRAIELRADASIGE